MRSVLSVVHLAPTPLVASPGTISRVLNREGTFRSTCVVLSDYPGALAASIMFGTGI